MSLEASVYALVTQTPVINTLIADRFYPNQGPQMTATSYCTYQVLGTTGEVNFSGPVETKRTRIQINCIGTDSTSGSYSASAAIATAFEALAGYKGNILDTQFLLIMVEDASDIFNPETKRHFRSLDLIIYHKEI